MYTLIIVLLAGSYDGGVAMQKVEGFPTESACNKAAAKIPVNPHNDWTQELHTYCLPVRE
jgi:hypothetical protein